MRDFQLPGRSTVHGAGGMAASSHPLSSLVAIETLKDGGNAVDAAIAAAALQAVVEPHSTGIGGDCFVLFCQEGSGDVIALNGSGRAPAAADVDWYHQNNLSRIELDSPHAVTVPGAVDAWARLLCDFGTKSLANILEPAIHYAENGYVVTPRNSIDWSRSVDKLRRDPTAARIYLPNGRSPIAGEVIRQPELAATLRILASEGRDGFYKGYVALDIVNYLAELGGLHTIDDFSRHSSEYVSPISSSYRDHDIYQCPPNSQGIAVLIMLGILEGFNLNIYEPLSVERLHLEAEATRLAYWVCEQTLGDPDQVEILTDEIMSKDHIAELQDRVRLDRASESIPTVAPMHPETIYLTVVDSDRNAVSLINSVAYAFGSGRVSPRTGVVLQNRGASFVLDSNHPNCIASGKRPRHTLIPGLVCKDGRVELCVGVMGGQYQPVGQVHVITNMLEFGMDVQEAIDLSRGFHFGGEYQLESGIADSVARGLDSLGHRVTAAGIPLGSGQAIQIDWENNALIGGSDSRKDGSAIGY